jgi:hypothetical protein
VFDCRFLDVVCPLTVSVVQCLLLLSLIAVEHPVSDVDGRVPDVFLLSGVGRFFLLSGVGR